MAQNLQATPATQALAAMSMLEGVIQILRIKGIASDAEVTSMLHSRAAAWSSARSSPQSAAVAALLVSIAGDAEMVITTASTAEWMHLA
jgi:hypothetical protein